jgi:hypothetical protein
MQAAGESAGLAFESDPRYLAARAAYLTALHDAGIEGHPDPLHGHPPTEIADEHGELF